VSCKAWPSMPGRRLRRFLAQALKHLFLGRRPQTDTQDQQIQAEGCQARIRASTPSGRISQACRVSPLPLSPCHGPQLESF
jgi:hypothetical protein